MSMPKVILVGSGPAAVGAALALTDRGACEVTVLDVGNRLPEKLVSIREKLAASPRQEWSVGEVAEITANSSAPKGHALPQKRSYGSAFPFEDVGQLEGIRADINANASVVSGAYGGFSNVWGSQIMPFSATSFDEWPCSFGGMEPHYRRILQEVPLAAEVDSLAEDFPLIRATSSLPVPSERTVAVLRRAKAKDALLRRHGVRVGNARLAFRASNCVLCGLCMTGCPHELIYSASQTFDRLRRQGKVRYIGGVLVTRVGQEGESCSVRGRELSSGKFVEFRADRVFVACGGIGTTRLVLGSLREPPQKVELLESIQFGVPLVSRRPVGDPRNGDTYTLNQFNLLVDVSGAGRDLVQIHCYPYNPIVGESLPQVLRGRMLEPLSQELLRRMTVGLGYLPSWASPRVILEQTRREGELPSIRVSGTATSKLPMLRKALRALLRVAPAIDLWPVRLGSFVSGPAKSYHFGGSFPHAPLRGQRGTDSLGRLLEWDRIHMVDASVFPSIPATTFTLTVMANCLLYTSDAADE